MTVSRLQDVAVNQPIEACLQVRRVRSRAGRDGRRYWVLTLSDGAHECRAFVHPDAGPVQVGQMVRVWGRTRLVDGELELLLRSLTPLAPIPGPGLAHAGSLRNRLIRLVELVVPPYRALLEALLADAAFAVRFGRAPASVAHHHAYAGGLLQHTVEVMEAGLRLRPLLPVAVDQTLLLTAGFCHDLGKVDTYTEQPPYALTPEGRALGHEWLGLTRLFRVVESLPAFPPEATGRLLATLTDPAAHSSSSPPPEREVLRLLDGLSVRLGLVGSPGPAAPSSAALHPTCMGSVPRWH